jgi:hypothetical protein
MASDGELLQAAFEAGRAAVFEVFGELADGPRLRSVSKLDAQWQILPDPRLPQRQEIVADAATHSASVASGDQDGGRVSPEVVYVHSG